MNLIKEGDAKLIELTEGVTTELQLRGIIPLNTLRMAVDIVFYLSWIVTIVITIPNIFILTPVLVIAILGMIAAYKSWVFGSGYWNDKNKTAILNAHVMLNRDRLGWRVFMSSLALTMVINTFMGIYPAGYPSVAGLSIIVSEYIRCCHYLGPGDYQREYKLTPPKQV